MWRRFIVLGVLACAVGMFAAAPAAFAATPQQIYRDYADNGRLDHQYSKGDLQRALKYAALQGYSKVGVQGAVQQARVQGSEDERRTAVHRPRSHAACRRRCSPVGCGCGSAQAWPGSGLTGKPKARQMAMRSVNAEALPALEPLELERSESRRSGGAGLASWGRGALVLDLVLLAVAATMSQLEAARDRESSACPRPGSSSTAGSPFSCCACAGCTRGSCGSRCWRRAHGARSDSLAAMTVVSLRILLPGNVDNLAPQMLRLFAFSAVYLAAGGSRSTGRSSGPDACVRPRGPR